MPWRLIFVVILMGVVVTFIGMNIENRADVSFGFYQFTDVPIFISLFTAFLTGVVVMLPFTFGFRRRSKEKKRKREKIAMQEGPGATQKAALPDKNEAGGKKGLFGRSKKKKDSGSENSSASGTPEP